MSFSREGFETDLRQVDDELIIEPAPCPSKPASWDQARAQRTALIADIVRRYEPALLSYLSQFGTQRHDPEDLAQEVFIRLLKLPNLEHARGIKSYLFRTARCVIVDEARKANVRHASDHGELNEDVEGENVFSPERLLEGQQELNSVFHALDELPERTRDVFLLYNFKNLVQAEIADEMGVGLSTVELHLSKARKHLLALI